MQGTPKFSVDPAEEGLGRAAWHAFEEGWHDRIGSDQALPVFTPSTIGSFRAKVGVGRLDDVILTDVRVASAMRTSALPDHHDHEVRLYAVHRGSITFDDPDGRGRQSVPAGGFLIQHVRRSMHFQTSPGLEAQIIALPATTLAPLLGRRVMTGAVAKAEMHLLLAHCAAVHSTLGELETAGAQAARGALIELARGLVLGRFDQREPATSGALVAAARALADARLTDPENSPAVLARELNVSLRTLQRAFSQTGESARGYIHRRRLEEARAALIATPGLRIADAAACWQFADSSHFVKAFKKRYESTPADVIRSSLRG